MCIKKSPQEVLPHHIPVVKQLGEGQVVEHTLATVTVDLGQDLVNLILLVRAGISQSRSMEDYNFTPNPESTELLKTILFFTK